MSLVLSVAVSGCGFAMERVSEDWEPSHDPWCTSSRAGPIGGVVVAVGFGALALFMASEHADCNNDWCGSLTTAFGLTSLGLAAGGTIGAVKGFGDAARCREAERAHQRWLADHPPSGEPKK